MGESIEWGKFKDNFVRLEPGVEKRLHLTRWEGGEWFDRQGIGFVVLQEDGKKVKGRKLTVTSRRLIRLLKPIILKAEEQGQKDIAVGITRSGEGVNTTYTVRELKQG